MAGLADDTAPHENVNRAGVTPGQWANVTTRITRDNSQTAIRNNDTGFTNRDLLVVHL